MEHDAFADRERALENAYFRKKDRELVERMRTAAAAEEARHELGRLTGLSDPAVQHELQALGFTPDTVVLLPVMPALEVGWAEDDITDAERHLIVRLARSLGVAEGDPADRQLAEWMQTRPSPDVFVSAARLTAAMLETTSHEIARDLLAEDLLEQCRRIAEASNGILGTRLFSVSREEQTLLDRLAADMASRRRPST